MIEEYMAAAYRFAKRSPDKSNQNGCVVFNVANDNLLAWGYNRFYDGVPPTDERPAKYERIAHAEFDCCLDIGRQGRRIDCFEDRMFCPWAACKNCALAILGTNIRYLYIHADRCLAYHSTRHGSNIESLKDWQPDIDESFQWLKDGGVVIEFFSGSVPFDGTIKINGMDWSPKTLRFV